MKKLSLLVLAFAASFSVVAQDVDEIITTYFENTGGYENWGNLKGIKVSAKMNQQGQEFPVEFVQMADGRQYTKFEIQGQVFFQEVYDGEVLWNTNFQSQKAEKADAESIANHKLEAMDFPDPLYNYSQKGYTAELLGKETMDGAETYKIKLTKKNKMVDGQEAADVVFFYFDAEAMIPLGRESEILQGQAKGATVEMKMSDYQEVDGFYFPFSMSQGVKGGGSVSFIIDTIEINPEIDDSVFAFPTE